MLGLVTRTLTAMVWHQSPFLDSAMPTAMAASDVVPRHEDDVSDGSEKSGRAVGGSCACGDGVDGASEVR